MENQVAERTKKAYVKQLYKTQYGVVAQLQQQDIGKVYECVIDAFSNEEDGWFVYKGRTQFMAPEIDGIVYVYSKRKLEEGQFVDVKITNALEYDLIGEIV